MGLVLRSLQMEAREETKGKRVHEPPARQLERRSRRLWTLTLHRASVGKLHRRENEEESMRDSTLHTFTLHPSLALWTCLIRALQMSFMLLIGHVFPHHNPVMEDDPLAGLVAWDYLWFHAIAQYGYSVPQTIAFFPGMPFLIKHIPPSVLVLVWPFISGLTAMFQQNIMHRIGWSTRGLTHFSTALLFCLTPSSAHFSSLYSETPFSFLSTLCVWCSLNIETSTYPTRWILLSMLLSMTASLFRSNGLLLFGFVACGVLRMERKSPNMLLKFLIVILLGLCVLLPIHFHLVNACREMHIDIKWWEPLPGYSKVQEQFWNVGFLKYYKVRNIPRFLLMFPSFAAWIAGLWKLLCKTCKKRDIVSSKIIIKPFLLPWSVIISVHALVQMLVCLLCANVEIFPRLLWASSPIIISEMIPKWSVLVLMSQGVLGQWLFSLHYAYT